ncbi:alpha/beta fold hydrolase [Campylobacter mucosalis]|uniref:Alpha/beta hydrolase family protein n=1 Tax=Campylobacter mucosalis CCUG 21559 TaxID=1032067 RepID=A0A6G5QHK5_9BACT|nr:alpha/beta hydrolase [Campylobacter mucosalis]QCD45112.1 alpha/beta hydrolase family protein [Campylobacter mucosalis CCUG 21559]QKF63028.1 alpha/beta hydrolase family protein [Campylobacter mucosalis]
MASKEIRSGLRKYKISYEMLNPDNDEIVLFLHGWGANKEIMKKAFGGYFTGYKHIYLDMPGFGDSDIFSPLYTSDYAKIVRNFIKTLPKEPSIVVGHSFGGKVATLLEPRNIVLLSSAGIPVKKRLWVRFKIAIFKFLKIFGLGKFYKIFATKDVSGMSRTMYETLKNVVNEDFSSKFANLNSRAFIFWGENDKATPLKSGEKMHELIKHSKFYPLKGDHFFFLLHAKFISEEVCRLLRGEESCIESISTKSDANEQGDESGIEFLPEEEGIEIK